MKLLFLDIDGVLNRHIRLESGYCGIEYDCVQQLNYILKQVYGLKIVVSSSWRYMYHRGELNRRGFEMMLMMHGVCCDGRIHGFTEPDNIPAEPSHFDTHVWNQIAINQRMRQIKKYVSSEVDYVVVDDLPLVGVENFVQTDPVMGLTRHDAEKIINMFKGI